MARKIDARKLKEFLEKVTLKSNIEEFVMEFTNDGLIVNVKTPDGANAVLSVLKAEVFSDYSTSDVKYGIKKGSRLINVLSTFNGQVSLDIDTNLLTVYNKTKSASFVLAKPEFITDTTLPQVPEAFDKFDSGVTLSSAVFVNALKNTNILGSDVIDIDIKDNVLNLQVGENNFDKVTEKVEAQYKNIHSKFQSALKIVIPCLTQTTTMSILEKNGPIQLNCKTEDYIIRFIAAPTTVEESNEKRDEPSTPDTEESNIEDKVEVNEVM